MPAQSPDSAHPADPHTTLFRELYADLRDLARAQLRREGPQATVQPTSLVHSLWLRWQGRDGQVPTTREDFLALAAYVMRQVLIDHARARDAQKRGGGRRPLLLSDAHLTTRSHGIDLLELDEALRRLDRLHDRQRKVVEMMFFGGLTQPEIAKVLGVSERTVRGDWISAQAWLRQELRRE